jgi:hypothetical protein
MHKVVQDVHRRNQSMEKTMEISTGTVTSAVIMAVLIPVMWYICQLPSGCAGGGPPSTALQFCNRIENHGLQML